MFFGKYDNCIASYVDENTPHTSDSGRNTVLGKLEKCKYLNFFQVSMKEQVKNSMLYPEQRIPVPNLFHRGKGFMNAFITS